MLCIRSSRRAFMLLTQIKCFVIDSSCDVSEYTEEFLPLPVHRTTSFRPILLRFWLVLLHCDYESIKG